MDDKMNFYFDKERNRKPPTFANINLLGKCNAKCFFCLGNDLKSEYDKYDQTNVHFSEWLNFEKFLDNCVRAGIKKLYITGQNVDSLQYKYLGELINYLQSIDYSVGLRTNGYLAPQMMDTINSCHNEVGYSFHTLRPNINQLIMGRMTLPDIDYLLTHTDNSRVSIVVNRYNHQEFEDIVEKLASYPKVKYIQARKISTETRKEFHAVDVEIYEKLYEYIKERYSFIKKFYGAEIYNMFGKEVCFWRTVNTEINSFNYYTDGTVSDQYFIVEGYVKYALNGIWPTNYQPDGD